MTDENVSSDTGSQDWSQPDYGQSPVQVADPPAPDPAIRAEPEQSDPSQSQWDPGAEQSDPSQYAPPAQSDPGSSDPYADPVAPNQSVDPDAPSGVYQDPNETPNPDWTGPSASNTVSFDQPLPTDDNGNYDPYGPGGSYGIQPATGTGEEDHEGPLGELPEHAGTEVVAHGLELGPTGVVVTAVGIEGNQPSYFTHYTLWCPAPPCGVVAMDDKLSVVENARVEHLNQFPDHTSAEIQQTQDHNAGG